MTPAPAAARGGMAAAFRLPHRWRVALGLLAVVTAVHAEALAPGRAFYSRDLYRFWHPAVEVFVRAVGEGAWPVWNPFFGFGEPMAGNPNFQIPYPPTWLNLVMPAPLYFKLYVVGHALLGALGTARLVRRLRAGPWGQFAAGAAFAANGALLSAISMYHHYAGAAWMPWVLLALERALRQPGPRAVALLAAAAASQLLAGSGDMCFMSALLGVGWLVASVVRGCAAAARPLRAIALLAAAGILALLLAAVQWLPAVALLPGTVRGGPAVEANAYYWSLHPLSLVDLVASRLTTGAAATVAMGPAARAALFESREPLLASVYLGIPAAAAALLALVIRRHRRTALVLAGGVLALVAAALGRHAPVLPALLHVPGVAVFRFPPKYLLPAAVLWPLLVGLGADALARARGVALGRAVRPVAVAFAAAGLLVAALTATGTLPSLLGRALADPLPADPLLPHVRSRLLTAALLSVLAAVACLAATVRGVGARAGAATLAVLSAADLVRDGRHVNWAAPIELTRYRSPLVDRLRGEPGPVRIHSVTHPKDWVTEQFVRYPAGWEPAAGWVLGGLDRVPGTIAARWGLMGSYEGDLTGLAPAMMGRLSGRVSQLSHDAAGLRLLQLGGVDYAIALDAGVFGGRLEPVASHSSVYREPVRLLRTPDPLPKAFLTAEARVVPDEELALRMIMDPRFDARGMVVLSAATPTAAPPALAAPADKPPEGVVEASWRRADALAFRVHAAAPSYLVVLESFERGWTASIDGAPAPVLKANLLFRAVPVPAGVHVVEMRYRPRALAWGALASAAAAAALAVLFRWPTLR